MKIIFIFNNNNKPRSRNDVIGLIVDNKKYKLIIFIMDYNGKGSEESPVDVDSSSRVSTLYCVGFKISIFNSHRNTLNDISECISEFVIDLCLLIFLSQMDFFVQKQVAILPCIFYLDYVKRNFQNMDIDFLKYINIFSDPEIKYIVIPIVQDTHYSCLIYLKSCESNVVFMYDSLLMHDCKAISDEIIR